MPDATVEQQPGEDRRFTVGLLVDVDHVLVEHGYRRLSGPELRELGQHLLCFLHGAAEGRCSGKPREAL